MADANSPPVTLKRGLKNRHIQLIALGGAIGTGLFLGSAGVLKSAGPSMILGYAIAGFIAFLIMRQLGEMIVEEPVAGSFSHFAHKYWGGYAGFLSGWNYWVLYVLVGMAELTAVGKYIQFWWPEVPTWVSAVVFFVLVNLINTLNVKVFGEMEFWFAIIKVVAIVGMIVLGCYLLFSGTGGPQASISNLWSHGGFFPNGGMGLLMAMAFIMFSFGGLELVGITAAEASEPKKVIPKAINQVVYRILIFYVGALTVLLALYPWDQLLVTLGAGGDAYGSSPFVQIFALIGSDTAAQILNFVVLTAALSVYNSGVYCNSRMLFGLAEQGDVVEVGKHRDQVGPHPIQHADKARQQGQADQAQGLLVDLFDIQGRLFDDGIVAFAGFLGGLALGQCALVGQAPCRHGQAAHKGCLDHQPEHQQVEGVDQAVAELERGVVIAKTHCHEQRQR